MEFQLPTEPGPRPKLVIAAPSAQSENGVPSLFKPGDFADASGGEDGRWFFNMKVHQPPAHNYPPSEPPQPAPKPNTHLEALPTPRQVKAAKTKAGTSSRKQPREQSKAAAAASRGGAGNSGKPSFNRNRKLQALPTPSPSPAELKEQIDIQTARSIGDSLIFHNIPEHCEDTPEAEIVSFCKDYLVGRRIEQVNFGHVHKMEDRFGKDPPIAARFTLSLPSPADQSGEEGKKYQPLPYIPPIPRRRLPILKGKNRRKTQYSVDT